MAKKDTYFTDINGQGFKPTPQTPITPFTPTETEQKNQPQTISEQIASSVNPELEFQKYLYQTGLENVFSQYQKNIANLDKARQQDIADAYFIREMSKKYLGEYASNVGIGDVSGNLIDIYANYAENISGINQNYESLKVGYEDSMTSESQKIAQNLLGTEVGLKLEEYNETLLQASTDIAKAIQTGDYGDYDNYTDYINSLDLPQKQKDDLLEWAEGENELFETTSLVQVKGYGINQSDLERFNLTEQPEIDLTYYTNEDVMSEYAYNRNGNLVGISTETTEIPTSALEGFNYRKDGNGFVTYQGDTYVYMQDETFHKLIQVYSPQENGEVTNYLKDKTKVTIGEVDYVVRTQDYTNSTGVFLYTIPLRLMPKVDSNYNDEKIIFYEGRYYNIYYEKGRPISINLLTKK